MKVIIFIIGLFGGCVTTFVLCNYSNKIESKCSPIIVSPQVDPTQYYEIKDYVSMNDFLKSINKSKEFVVFPISDRKYGICILSGTKSDKKDSDYITSIINERMNRIVRINSRSRTN